MTANQVVMRMPELQVAVVQIPSGVRPYRNHPVILGLPHAAVKR